MDLRRMRRNTSAPDAQKSNENDERSARAAEHDGR